MGIIGEYYKQIEMRGLSGAAARTKFLYKNTKERVVIIQRKGCT